MTDEREHAGPGKGGNRLANERSPYLLQHARNPVDWYPWGEEAFRRAREKNLPVFLSIGYSTCHWCHVMERESFENDAVAACLNAHFVAVKVDREERPDVDAVYMRAVQAMGIPGGWPLSLFLTPEGEPFYGGTYFPPEDRLGLPGFLSLLERLRDLWESQHARVLEAGARVTEQLRRDDRRGSNVPGPDLLEKGYALLKAGYDAVNGGFSKAPKFPRAHEIWFLLRQQRRNGDPEGLRMITHTLDAMADGGLHDHLGGGFHRYSTDDRWLVPHFEKMLYDQATLARAYLEAYQVTARERYADVARGILAYVLRDLRDPEGGFHSAEDADSEGEEGKFYVWTAGEIREALGPDSSRIFAACYGVTPEGSFERGTSILHVSRPAQQVAKELGIPEKEIRETLKEGRRRLFDLRSRRIRPHLDDKVLTDWNGLMISALAFGGVVLDEPGYVEAAGEAAGFVLRRLRDGRGRLLHTYRRGQAAGSGFLDDHAFLGIGLLDLYEASFDPRWLSESRRLAREAVRLFRDGADGAFTLVGCEGERLIASTKEIYDGAIPSGNSAAAIWLLRLGRLLADVDLHVKGTEILRAFAPTVERYPAGYTCYLVGLDLSVGPTREIVIAGEADSPETGEMIRAVRRRFMPDAVIALHEPGERGRDLESLVPFVKGQVSLDGKATAYVCRDHACARPTNDLACFEEMLDRNPPGGAP